MEIRELLAGLREVNATIYPAGDGRFKVRTDRELWPELAAGINEHRDVIASELATLNGEPWYFGGRPTQERDWPPTEPIAGSGPCQADDCKGKVAYVAGRGECDRCRIAHRVVANGALRRTNRAIDIQSRCRLKGAA
jgi:hypothetical protein